MSFWFTLILNTFLDALDHLVAVEEVVIEIEAHLTTEVVVIEVEEMTADLETLRKVDASNVAKEAIWREIALSSVVEDQDQGQDPEVATDTEIQREVAVLLADITAEAYLLQDLEMQEITEE